MKNDEHVSNNIKIISYIVSIGISFATGYTVDKYFNTLGFITGFITFLVLNLSDVRSNIQILVSEIPAAIKITGSFLSSPEFEPIQKLLHQYHVYLFKPIEHRIAVLENDADEFLGIDKSSIKLFLLFLFNSLALSLLTAKSAKNFIGEFIAAISLQLMLLGIYAYVKTIPNQKKYLAKGFPGLVWFPIIFFWSFFLLFPFSESMGLIELDILIVIGGIASGLAIGHSYGADDNIFKIQSGKSKFFVSIAVGVIIVGMMLSSTPISSIDNSTNTDIEASIIGVEQNAPILSAVSIVYLNLYRDFRISIQDERGVVLPTLGSKSYIFIAATSISFSATFVAFLFGRAGILLLVFEAPFFYISCILIRMKKESLGLRLLKQVVLFDEWREMNFWGEIECYRFLMENHPNDFWEIITSQLFKTARHDFAQNLFTEYITRIHPKESVKSLLEVFPFIEFQECNTDRVPDMSLLYTQRENPLFEIIYDRRKTIYQNMLQYSHRHNLDGDYSIITAYHDLLSFNSTGYLTEDAFSSLSNLFKFDEHYYLGPLTRLVQLADKSYSIRNIDAIGLLAQEWGVYLQKISNCQVFSNIYPLVLMLSEFAQSLKGFNTGKANISEAALLSINLKFARERYENESYFGVSVLNNIALYWETLLMAHLQEMTQVKLPE